MTTATLLGIATPRTPATAAALSASAEVPAPPAALVALATETIAASDGTGNDLTAFRAHMAGCGDTLSLTLMTQWLEASHTALPVALTEVLAGRERAEHDLCSRYTSRDDAGATTVNERAVVYRLALAEEALQSHSREAVERAFSTTQAWTQAALDRRGAGETVRLYRGLDGEAACTLREAVMEARHTSAAEVEVPVSFLSSWTAQEATARLFAGAQKCSERRGVVIACDVPRAHVVAASVAHPMLSRSAEDEWIVAAPQPMMRIPVEQVLVLAEESEVVLVPA